MSQILLRCSRAGGRPPSDNELLEITTAGTFQARRTVGRTRIGSFAGTFPDPTIKAVMAETAACRAAGALWLDTPRDGATLTIELGDEGDVTAVMDSGSRPEGPWGVLAADLRDLLDRAAEQPVAALELVADTRRARLTAAGPEPLDVDAATIEVRLVRLDAGGSVLDRWGSSGGEPGRTEPRWQRTGSAWSLELPYGQRVELEAGDWLQVWVLLTLRTDVERRGRLFVAVPGADPS